MEYTPQEIIDQLDRYIIGQSDAKRMVAVALRNRYRRSRLSDELREEVTPKNIIMKGPTGVGKTEIARRLAKLVKAPFVKVEATKFTEVGYVGRDVESMIRDLVEAAIRMVKEEKFAEVKPKAMDVAVRKVAKAMLPMKKEIMSDVPESQLLAILEQDLREGKLDDVKVKMSFVEREKPLSINPQEGGEINLGSIFGQITGQQKTKTKETYVRDAIRLIVAEESEKMVDMDNVNSEAIHRAEQQGIVFIDEIDKIAQSGQNHSGPDVSREGVQRDILPIVEGCTVNTKYGPIRTDYILFIAAGAFHVSEVKDLIPELQGRFPVVVDLHSLTRHDFVRILTEPSNAITRMYAELLRVDGVNLSYTDDGIDRIAEIAVYDNANHEDIGARRLHALMEKLLEEVSFLAQGDPMDVVVDAQYVDLHLNAKSLTMDLRKYII